jgi:hypothetical protein
MVGMVTLIEQVIGLAIMVGGVVVSALALKNPARRICIGTFSVLGLGNLALIVYTYEHTPGVPHFSDLPEFFAVAGIKGRDGLMVFAENHLVQLFGVLVIGVVLGVIVPREYQRRKRRQWFSSYDIFKLADSALMEDAVLAEDEIQLLMERISALREEREKLGLVSSLVPMQTAKQWQHYKQVLEKQGPKISCCMNGVKEPGRGLLAMSTKN